MNWSEKIGQEFQHRADKENDSNSKYTVIDVNAESLVLQRCDGYKLEAHLPQMNDNGTIEWSHSSGGHFVQDVPVYLEDISTARENGEMGLFKKSRQLNEECAGAIDKAINKYRESAGMPGSAHYDLKTALADVTDMYGASRVNAVVAHTVNKHDWDGRLSQKNKEWAKSIDAPKVDYIPLNTHLAVFDGFVNYAREAQQLQQQELEKNKIKPRKGTLKHLIDKELGGDSGYICVYNKYNDFLCEGKVSELRNDALWNLLDEQNARIRKAYSGTSENGIKGINVVLSNVPIKDRSKEQLQEQLTALYENPELNDIVDDDLRNEKTQEFNEQVNTLEEQIKLAGISELRKEAEKLDSLWYINEETRLIRNVYFNPDSEAGGTFVENVIYADELLEVAKRATNDFEVVEIDNFYDDLDVCCKQTNTDINTPEFELLINELKEDVENQSYSFIGDTEETMLGVIAIAEIVVATQEIANLKSMSDTQLMEHFLENNKDLTNVTAHDEMENRNLISKDDTFSTLRQKLEYYKENPQFEETKMKQFTLIIDTSAANPEGGQIYIHESDTLQEAKEKLTELNLSFEQGDVYCATIGERNNGTLNRYQQIVRTDDGVNWHEDKSDGHSYIPVEWDSVDNWQNIEKFKKAETAQKLNLTEEFFMQNDIIARVTPIENETKLKGVATVTVGGVAIHGVKIVEGDKGLFLSMPGEKSKTNDKFYETVLPASKEAHAHLKDTILTAYADALENGKQQMTDNPNKEAAVKVGSFRDNPNDNGIKADCQITINDVMVVKGVKVIANKETGELSVALPSKQNQDGEYHSVVTPTSKDFFAQIKQEVLKGYEQHNVAKAKQEPHRSAASPSSRQGLTSTKETSKQKALEAPKEAKQEAKTETPKTEPPKKGGRK